MEEAIDMDTNSSSDSDNSWMDEDEEQMKLLQEALTDCPRSASGSISYQSTALSGLDRELNYINSALLLNKLADEKYRHLEKLLSNRLRECRQKIKENEAEIMQYSIKQEDFRYIVCGKPYFKDKNCHTPPDNEDRVLMKSMQMYDFSDVTTVPGWTGKDKTQLLKELHKVSLDSLKLAINNKIEKLSREAAANSPLIISLRNELMALKKKPLDDIAFPLSKEYEWEAIANNLNRRHTAQEYRSLWKLFLHPSINKTNWSKHEHEKLLKIATVYKMEDWDAIAKQLNTSRTGYQCFVYYRGNINSNSVGLKWTEKETKHLERLIQHYREGAYIPWSKVASQMPNRTKIQVYNKYTRMVEYRKGRFVPEEDSVILDCYDKYGLNFRKISEFLPGRSALQLRARYHLLTKMRLSATWSVEDDKKLLQIMANSDSSASFSAATKHFPGKDRIHIRSRYKTLMRWMKCHPARDISLAPRRAPRRLQHGQANSSLTESIKNLQNRMKKDFKNKTYKKLSKHSPWHELVDAITLLFVKEIVEDQLKATCNEDNESEIMLPKSNAFQYTPNISNLQKILLLLKSSLNKTKMETSLIGEQSLISQELDVPFQKCNVVKVKSYSKKDRERTILLKDIPDVWGNISLSHKYILPPNFATITGCTVLMKHLHYLSQIADGGEINLSLMARRNPIFREKLFLLRERLTIVFLWPIVLSNDSPAVADNEVYVEHPKPTRKLLPEAPCITIPPINQSKKQLRRRHLIKKNETSSS